MVVDVPKTYGALLGGAFVSVVLSGVITAQVVVYFKTYQKDMSILRIVVFAIWILDLLHSAFICASVWNYLITHFGDLERIGYIPWTLPVTVVFTAVVTLLVHCFFTYRIFKLSRGNFWITAPIAILVVCRLCSACVTTSTMIWLKSFKLFLQRFRWVFTLGLSLSTTIDILITGWLCYFLQTEKTISPSLDAVIDSVLLYALENGALTCAATIVSTACWLTMPHNLIFMGVHFVIGKLYANSLLVSLNTRKQIRQKSLGKGPRLLNLSKHTYKFLSFASKRRGTTTCENSVMTEDLTSRPLKVNVNVTKTTEYGWETTQDFTNTQTLRLPETAYSGQAALTTVNLDMDEKKEEAESSTPPPKQTRHLIWADDVERVVDEEKGVAH